MYRETPETTTGGDPGIASGIHDTITEILSAHQANSWGCLCGWQYNVIDDCSHFDHVATRLLDELGLAEARLPDPDVGGGPVIREFRWMVCAWLDRIFDLVAPPPLPVPIDAMGPAVERPTIPPIVPAGGVERRPPFHGSSAAGGHPVEPTSDMLRDAAAEIQNLAAMAYSTRQPWIEGFAAELRDRAAQMAAHGD